MFSAFVGASGGPKWFTLFSLDKFLFGEFFKDRSTPLDIIGSSAGAFRAVCFCQRDPVAAISRLAKHYSETVYSEKVDRREISLKAQQLIDIVMGDQGTNEVLEHPFYKAHLFVAKANGLAASEYNWIQAAGLITAYLKNRLKRNYLSQQFHRYIFSTSENSLALHDPSEIPTHYLRLTKSNLKPALLASGSIPMVMSGVTNIPGAPAGMYRDGGILDYHFDIAIKTTDLVLYPHFNATPKAGWFDKNLKRKVHHACYDNIVLICPSPQLIETLPYQKIPDRSDFSTMDDVQRVNYWREVFRITERMAEDFKELLNHQDISVISPLTEICV